MATKHEVSGGGNLRLHVREWGNTAGIPILFIHGWSGSHLAWRHQYEGSLADEFRLVAMDLRGHGMSDVPLEADHYTDAQLWADDIAAIIGELHLDRPVLVGWSYGGFVIGDYLRAYGSSAISGVNYVGGGVKLTQASLNMLYGPGLLSYIEAATQPDLPTNIEAMRQFVRELVARPMAEVDFEYALAYNIIVPAEVRAALLMREIDSDDVLQHLAVPVLVSQGKLDQHVLPAMAEHILGVCPTAKASWYEAVAHMPFLEDPERFNTELSAFARATRS
ncbi:alpha/beta fold hydrolase [Halomonas ramblicola]|uniref:alpha/beta fold hydrolase n=1 Tax=Halomonas ramblicola TaxID=747349 RepID=UPI0025B34AAD|nr:alpha/beta hydrolase [Halomonas ramblicola]MDN3521117.1 alpha/beta hydrolase [Halomonas ramblicola]